MSRGFLLLLAVSITGWAADGQAPAKVPAGRQPRSHIRFGGILINAGYTRWSGYPYGWGYGPYGYYDPFFWSPLYYPGIYTGYAYTPGMGDVKVLVGDKSALVFLNGALAGRREQLKDMWLEPGTYNLEVRDGQRRFTRKIYVLSGRTLKITPDLMEQETLP
jgi:hypothetical protein